MVTKITQLIVISTGLCVAACFGMQDQIKKYQQQVWDLTDNRIKKSISAEQYVERMKTLLQQASQNNIDSTAIINISPINELIRKSFTDQSLQDIVFLYTIRPDKVLETARQKKSVLLLRDALQQYSMQQKATFLPVVQQNLPLPLDISDIVVDYITAVPDQVYYSPYTKLFNNYYAMAQPKQGIKTPVNLVPYETSLRTLIQKALALDAQFIQANKAGASQEELDTLKGKLRKINDQITAQFATFTEEYNKQSSIRPLDEE